HADADVEHRRVTARRDHAAAVDRHSLTWDRLLGHDERDELLLGAVALDASQLVGTREVLVERARPAEAGRDRVRLARDVVAMNRVTALEAHRVAGAEPARL